MTMTSRIFALAGGVIVAAVVAVAGIGTQAQTQAFRTPWGDPDIQGIFTTDDELGVPFERPEQFAGRELVTDKEFAERQAQAQRQADVDAEEFVAPRTGGRGGDGTGPPAHWLERGKPVAAHVDHHRSAGRPHPVSERRGTQARGGRGERSDERPASVRRPDGAGPVRSLHHARPART